MIKKNAFFKAVALCLSVVTVLSVSSCTGGSDNSAKKEAKKIVLENVYKTVYIDTAEEDGDLSIGNIHSVGDEIYMDAYFSKVIDKETGNYESGRNIYKINLENKKTELVKTFTNPRQAYVEGATSSTYENINCLAISDSKDVWYIKEKGYSDWSDPEVYVSESDVYLIKESLDGEKYFEISLSDTFSDYEYFYVSYIFFDENSTIIVSDYLLAFVSEDGTVTDVVDLTESGEYYNKIVMLDNGDIIGLTINWETDTPQGKFKKFDRERKEFVDYTDVDGEFYSFFCGDGNIVYYTNVMGVYSYDIVTGETKEVLNYINSDLNSNRATVIGVANGGFIAQEYTRDWSDSRIVFLEKASDEDVIEKYVIDFASVYLNDNIKDIIIDFNKQNTDYRINYIDYSQYAEDHNYETAINRLNQDIIKGNIPDIFSVEGLPLENYTSKNLIADLSVYMDKDKSFKKSDYLENILNITSENGKIYSVIPSFSVNTIMTQNKYFNGNSKVTIDDFLALRKNYPDSFLLPYYTSRQEFLTGYIGESVLTSYASLVNSGKGSFTDGTFAKYLEFAKAFPEEFDWEKFYEENPNFDEMNTYANGKTLTQFCMLSTFDISYSIRQHGEDYTFVGFPVPDSESSGFSIVPECEFAVSAKSVVKDEAWEFIKYLYSDEYQKYCYNFPVKKSVLEEKAEETLKRYADREEQSGIMPRAEKAVNGAFIAVDDVAIGYEDDKITFTRTDIDNIYRVLTSADFVARSDKEIAKIIEEESGAYFADKKSADDACKVIQGRVEQYIFENR